MALTQKQLMSIHLAIHGFADSFSLDGKEIPINMYKNGCRYVDIDSIRFMEQNRAKSSKFAELARQGALVTWGMRDDAPWIYIETSPKHFREYPFGEHTIHDTKISYAENHNL